jgi:hypothetical protein
MFGCGAVFGRFRGPRTLQYVAGHFAFSLPPTVHFVNAGQIQVGSLSLSVDTRSKMVERGKLFRCSRLTLSLIRVNVLHVLLLPPCSGAARSSDGLGSRLDRFPFQSTRGVRWWNGESYFVARRICRETSAQPSTRANQLICRCSRLTLSLIRVNVLHVLLLPSCSGAARSSGGLGFVNAGQIQVGSLSLSVDTRSKMVERGKLFRRKKDTLSPSKSL